MEAFDYVIASAAYNQLAQLTPRERATARLEFEYISRFPHVSHVGERVQEGRSVYIREARGLRLGYYVDDAVREVRLLRIERSATRSLRK